MKLWIKLALVIFVITNVVIEIVLFVVKPQVKEHLISLLGEKLKSTAAASAVAINGDEFKKLNFSDPSIINHPAYLHIKNQLSKTKFNLGLKEDIYTLTLINNNTALFGVTTNPKSYSGDTLHLQNNIPREALIESYSRNKCIYTKLYDDQYGTWISGMAPILDSYGKVVGVVQVDNSLRTVQASLSQIDKSILIIQLLFIPVTIFLSITIGMYFTKPIKEAKKRIDKISSGDYSENVNINARGEIKEILSAAENLRITILEQQEKIFTTLFELRNAKQKAEASSRMKGEFLALISHEIRTPLNIILGNLEVLKYEFEGEKLMEVEEITDSVKLGSLRLIRTVEMIVLYSELASGSYIKTEKIVNVNNLFFSLVDNYKKIADEKGLQLNSDCMATTGVIKADERLLGESLTQLIDNAVKFSTGGSITFCIAKKNEGIKILIMDNGIGISKNFMTDLFKPFRQEDMSIARQFEGNGLGLAIVKKCCELSGFELKIESEKNKGTTVEVYIPKEKLFNA